MSENIVAAILAAANKMHSARSTTAQEYVAAYREMLQLLSPPQRADVDPFAEDVEAAIAAMPAPKPPLT